MAYIGIDPAGVQAWKSQLDAKHAAIISALDDYKRTAAQNNEVAKGAHFTHINAQCDEIVGKHLTAHHELHTQYTNASDKLVQGIYDVAGH
jgi:hypothetical protein